MRKRQYLLKIMLVTIATCCFAGCGTSGVPIDDGIITGSVQLEIDFRSRRKEISVEVPCASDSTVLSVLRRAKASGDLEFLFSGEADTAFVNSIGGVKNQAANGDNWVYLVNAELGDRSCGAFFIKPDDHVLWVFGKYP